MDVNRYLPKMPTLCCTPNLRCGRQNCGPKKTLESGPAHKLNFLLQPAFTPVVRAPARQRTADFAEHLLSRYLTFLVFASARLRPVSTLRSAGFVFTGLPIALGCATFRIAGLAARRGAGLAALRTGLARLAAAGLRTGRAVARGVLG